VLPDFPALGHFPDAVDRGRLPLDAHLRWVTCALYLMALTARRCAGALRRSARAPASCPSPAQPSPVWEPRVVTVLEGIARTHGSAPAKRSRCLRDPLLEVIDSIDPMTPTGYRTGALLIGFALGLRRSELIAASEHLWPHTTTA
jgi:hypothetical protein